MNTEMWAAIIGSLVLVVCSGVGALFWSHMTTAKEDASQAHSKAHELEVRLLKAEVSHSEELRAAQHKLFEHQLHVANEYVRKSDHDNVIAELFRKLENQDRQMTNGFAGLRTWLDTKFEHVTQQLHGKQDRAA